MLWICLLQFSLFFFFVSRPVISHWSRLRQFTLTIINCESPIVIGIVIEPWHVCPIVLAVSQHIALYLHCHLVGHLTRNAQQRRGGGGRRREIDRPPTMGRCLFLLFPLTLTSSSVHGFKVELSVSCSTSTGQGSVSCPHTRYKKVQFILAFFFFLFFGSIFFFSDSIFLCVCGVCIQLVAETVGK